MSPSLTSSRITDLTYPFASLMGISNLIVPTKLLVLCHTDLYPKSFPLPFLHLNRWHQWPTFVIAQLKLVKGTPLPLMCLQMNWSGLSLAGLVLSSSCVCHPHWTSGPPKACCHDGAGMARPRRTVQAHLKPLLMSWPLASCQPKPIS